MKTIFLLLAAGAMLGGLATSLQATAAPQKACAAYDPTDPNSPPQEPNCTCSAGDV